MQEDRRRNRLSCDQKAMREIKWTSEQCFNGCYGFLVMLLAWEQCRKVFVWSQSKKSRSKLCHASLNEWPTEWMNESRKEMYRRSTVNMYPCTHIYINRYRQAERLYRDLKNESDQGFSSSHSQAALACFSHVLSCSPFRLNLAAVSIIITFFAPPREPTRWGQLGTQGPGSLGHFSRAWWPLILFFCSNPGENEKSFHQQSLAIEWWVLGSLL